MVSRLTPEQRSVATPLGDGTWTVKDLLGHLATHEHRALVVMGVRGPAGEGEVDFDDVHEFNARHLEIKRTWSLEAVATDYATTRDALVAAIEATDEDHWREKIPHGRGRSALGLVLAKMLNGDKYGFFAHDFAHSRGLERAVAALVDQKAASG